MNGSGEEKDGKAKIGAFVRAVFKWLKAASNSVVGSKKRQTKSGGLGGRRQSPKRITSARRKKTAEAEASSDSDQGYLNSLGFIFFATF